MQMQIDCTSKLINESQAKSAFFLSTVMTKESLEVCLKVISWGIQTKYKKVNVSVNCRCFRVFSCIYNARGLLGVICLLACSSCWSAQRKDLTLSERRENIWAQAPKTDFSTAIFTHAILVRDKKFRFITSQLGENVDLQVEDVFQLSCVYLTVIVNLLGHFQKPLLIFQPENWLLKSEKPFHSFSNS